MKRNIFAALALAVSGLACAQQFQVVVTTTDGEKRVYETSDVNRITFENAPNYVQADRLLGTGYYNPQSNTSAFYNLTITDCGTDQYGEPEVIGGIQLTLTLVGNLAEDPYNAQLPAGYYRAGLTSEPFTWNLEKSGLWIRVTEDEDGVVDMFMFGGAIDVRRADNGDYDIRCEMNAMDGSIVNIRYQGAIEFIPGHMVYEEFQEDQDIPFDMAQGLYWGNWYVPFTDDMAVQFYNGYFDHNDQMVEGYWLNLDLYAPKNPDPVNFRPVLVADGTYTVDPRDAVFEFTYPPYTFKRGVITDVFGTLTPTNTYIMHIDSKGRRRLALINGGEVTVSDNGHHFKFDLIAENGVHIRGEYQGTPQIINKCDNDISEPPMADYVDRNVDLDLDRNEKAVCVNYVMGDYLWPGLNSHIVMFTDPTFSGGDYISAELFCESDKLKDGVYPISSEFKDGVALRGIRNYAQDMIFTWYGDLDEVDDEGYNTFIAPIYEGTITVTTVDPETETQKFDFDLKTSKGYSITGSWTTKVHTVRDSDMQAPAKCHARGPKTRRAPRK
ncbi:MAG: hypothetical protein K2O24_01275 [Muribaculaceae bacterium]|nr:hypothetical protein [Muribaculaceae bacterium]